MLSPIVVGTIIYGSMLVILCVGFTLTHIMEKFPNFAHTSYAVIGTILAFNFVRLWGYNPYLVWPFAFMLGGGVGMVLYLCVVRPMQRFGSSGIMISFAMLALSTVLTAVLSIYSYWILISYGFRVSGFSMRNYDFSWMDYPGILFVAPLISMIMVIALHLFLTRIRFGIAIRATAEKPELATALGVNVLNVHLASWFLTGAFSALAGAVLPLWIPTSLGYSDELLISIMAGSVLGGLDSIYGAIVGGVFVTITQRILPVPLMSAFGVWIGGYSPLIPIMVIVAVLLLEPKGLTGILEGDHLFFDKVRKALGAHEA
jgi:branched-chain amino acid transport system permease protein